VGAWLLVAVEALLLLTSSIFFFIFASPFKHNFCQTFKSMLFPTKEAKPSKNPINYKLFPAKVG